MHEALAVGRADRFLRAAHPDERQRAYAMRWLGWLAFHLGADERLDWWAIPAWVPAAQLVTARRLAAWAVLTAAAGLAIAATPWAAILFGIVGWITAVQAVFISFGDQSTPPVLRPGGPRVVVPRGLRRREAVKLAASAIPLVVTAVPFLVRLWAIPAAGRPAASAARAYRADRMTSLIGARLAGLSDGTITRVCVDLGIGAWLSWAVWIALIGESVHDPLWLLAFLSVVAGGGLVLIGFRMVNELLRGIVGSARWRQANLAGLSGLGRLRGDPQPVHRRDHATGADGYCAEDS